MSDSSSTHSPSDFSNSPTRLNKYISNSGYCARRKADKLILAGKVVINGKTVQRLATWVTEKDVIVVNNTPITTTHFKNPITLLLNKPIGIITTNSDPQRRETIILYLEKKLRQKVNKLSSQNSFKLNDFKSYQTFKKALKEVKRFVPIGRLDKNTSGAIVLTQDRRLSHEWSHPSKAVKKTYLVTCEIPLNKNVEAISNWSTKILNHAKMGLKLEDGFFQPDDVIMKKQFQYSVTIHSGKNRILRRYFEALGTPVKYLHRYTFHHFNCNELENGDLKIIHPQSSKI